MWDFRGCRLFSSAGDRRFQLTRVEPSSCDGPECLRIRSSFCHIRALHFELQIRSTDVTDLFIRMQKMALRVLVADDHGSILGEVNQVLLQQNCKVVASASNGPALLSVANASAPDLIVLDVSMPEMSGIEVARRLGQVWLESTNHFSDHPQRPANHLCSFRRRRDWLCLEGAPAD